MKHLRHFTLLFASLGLWQALHAQAPLDDESIIKMVKAGLGDDVIVSVIASQPGRYAVAPDDLVALKKAGVSERVMGAIVARASGAPVAPNAGMAPIAAAPQPTPYDALDIGVYVEAKNGPNPVPSEAVNWKTGGALKMIATDGIVKGDVNGRLSGPGSATRLTLPVTFVLKTADGVEAKDFQLVRLHEKNNAREFRTLTGGVFHASGGASRDAVNFDQKLLGHHTYEVTLAQPLAPGQYAFLAPGLASSTVSGSTGKAYTFQILE